MNIYIEGNIGTGKTTFLERLREEASNHVKQHSLISLNQLKNGFLLKIVMAKVF